MGHPVHAPLRYKSQPNYYTNNTQRGDERCRNTCELRAISREEFSRAARGEFEN